MDNYTGPVFHTLSIIDGTMEPIFLSVETESFLHSAHLLLFGSSAFFNALATFCLWRQAPEMQSDIKAYLYGMQVVRVDLFPDLSDLQALLFLSDVILDVAIEPIALLPVLGGYSKGVLGEWFDIHDALVKKALISNIFFVTIERLTQNLSLVLHWIPCKVVKEREKRNEREGDRHLRSSSKL